MQRTCRFSSPDSQFAFWLMIVSMQTAVLPVLRSPMINWRWPRPIGVIESMALMPVCRGSRTLCRCTTETADRLGQRVHHPAEERVTDRDRENLTGPLDLLPLFQGVRVAEDHRADG